MSAPENTQQDGAGLPDPTTARMGALAGLRLSLEDAIDHARNEAFGDLGWALDKAKGQLSAIREFDRALVGVLTGDEQDDAAQFVRNRNTLSSAAGFIDKDIPF